MTRLDDSLEPIVPDVGCRSGGPRPLGARFGPFRADGY